MAKINEKHAVTRGSPRVYRLQWYYGRWSPIDWVYHGCLAPAYGSRSWFTNDEPHHTKFADGHVRKVVDETFIGEIGWSSELAYCSPNAVTTQTIHIVGGVKAMIFSLGQSCEKVRGFYHVWFSMVSFSCPRARIRWNVRKIYNFVQYKWNESRVDLLRTDDTRAAATSRGLRTARDRMHEYTYTYIIHIYRFSFF